MQRLVFAAAVIVAASQVSAAEMGGNAAHGPTMQDQSHAAISQDQAPLPREGGQSAFAAIQEIVEMLEADPGTDWSKVNVEALRQHLIDMDTVTLGARATSEETGDGIRFLATGDGAVVGSIRRMVFAHSQVMNGVGGWTYEPSQIPNGAALTVRVANAGDMARIKALGFIGVLAKGSHHQAHHLMIASGRDPHP